MFFTISKIFSYILNPLGWIVIIMLIGLFTKKSNKKTRWFLTAFLLLMLFTNPFLGDEALRAWEMPIRASDNQLINMQENEDSVNYQTSERAKPQLEGSRQKQRKYKAGVLLCGDIASYDKITGRIIFRSGADRLLQTIELYTKRQIMKIIISGGSGHLIYKDRTEAAFIKKYLVSIGISPEDIIFESRSKNTYENAKFTKELLVENNINDEVLLITSALHMKRASATFKKQGIIINEYATSKIVGERLKNADHLLIPSITTMNNWKLLIHEWIGFVIYKMLGYC